LRILAASVAFLPLLVPPFDFVNRILAASGGFARIKQRVSIRFDHYQFFDEIDGSEVQKNKRRSAAPAAAEIPRSTAGRSRVRPIVSSEIVARAIGGQRRC
jgi:hypothetical protein